MPYLYISTIPSAGTEVSAPMFLAPVKAPKKAPKVAKAPNKFTLSEGAGTRRYNISDATLASWLAESDSDKRSAILADVDAVEGSSNIHPSLEVFDGYRAMVAARATAESTESELVRPPVVLFRELSEGFLILPTSARGKSGAGATNARKMTAAERTLELAEAMFAESEPFTDSELAAIAAAEADGTLAPVGDVAPAAIEKSSKSRK